MKKRKTLEEREDEEEHKSKYLINTDLIEGFLKDQDEIQDVTSLRDQAMAQLINKDSKKPALLPNQSMASIQELKRELEKAKTNPQLSLSILETLVQKSSGSEKSSFLHRKIEIFLELNNLQSAESDMKSLLSVESTAPNHLLYSRILNRRKDCLASMTEFLRSGMNPEELSVSELYNSLVSQLQKSSYAFTLFTFGSNIHYTLGDGTQDSSQKLKFLTELKGRVILTASCGEFHTLALASNCLHLSKNEPCSDELYSEGTDLIGWGDNSHGQLLKTPSQAI